MEVVPTSSLVSSETKNNNNNNNSLWFDQYVTML